ncbi:MAG: hypothetical protein GX442_09675 [Candidatus Riflebacteria bacterium]|nr:hypothetical protein [Candidatus Riflebacteria bacterium]
MRHPMTWCGILVLAAVLVAGGTSLTTAADAPTPVPAASARTAPAPDFTPATNIPPVAPTAASPAPTTETALAPGATPAAPTTEAALAPGTTAATTDTEPALASGATPAPTGTEPATAAPTAAAGVTAELPFTRVGAAGPVTFRHAFHAGIHPCADCHEGATPLFPMARAASAYLMADMYAGKTCGACHDGKKAFASTGCARCHAVE